MPSDLGYFVRISTLYPRSPCWWVGPYVNERLAWEASRRIERYKVMEETRIIFLAVENESEAWRNGARIDTMVTRVPETVIELYEMLDSLSGRQNWFRYCGHPYAKVIEEILKNANEV
jgi:hypothetical protein